tara:strand:- start:2223 stop:3803 length:1581 start_codon:yes stop_codon:yes gene_type:complete
MIFSKELEQKFLATLLNHPESFAVVCGLVYESDFFTDHDSFVHKTIFKLIKMAHESGEGTSLDASVLIERLRALNISFPDNLDAGDYIESLILKKTAPEKALSLGKEIKSYSAIRHYCELADQMKAKANSLTSQSVPDIVKNMDSLFNSKVDFYCDENTRPENIYDNMESLMEDLADNPRDAGMLAPHLPYCNRMYGSLVRPGNISVICARTGVGKTTFCLDFVTKVSAAYDHVPVLHFDNGEMSKEEIQIRQCSALSGVPSYLLENGKWKNSSYIDPLSRREISAEETRNKVYSALKDMKGRKFSYFNVAGYSVEEMIQVARRFWLNEVGRGNPMLFSFDYIKLGNESSSGKSSWDVIGEMLDKFKQFIQSETVHQGRPSIGMITSVQANRLGIVGNRGPEGMIEDQSIIAGSDKISSLCTHLFILRRRTNQEFQTEPDSYGPATHRLKCIKYRHLGEDRMRATEPVLVPALDDNGDAVGNSRAEDNSLLLRIDNFGVSETGDLRDLAQQMRTQGIVPDEDGEIL